MKYGSANFTGPLSEGKGIHFLNEEWNDSISNGESLTLRWNYSLDPASSPQLGLFKLTYPRDGVVVYELMSNLTDFMSNDSATCQWTPTNLEDDLYAFWLGSTVDSGSNWTASPPWRLMEPSRYPFHWATPIIIPIVVLLFLYFLGLTTCVLYRRRKRARRQKEPDNEDLPPLRDTDRHPSVDTIVTIQTLDDSDEPKKPGIWLLTQSQSGSLLLSSNRKPSQPTVATACAVSSETTLTSPTSLSELTLLTPTSTTSETTLISPTTREYKVARVERQGRTVRVVVPTDDS